jgi:exosortase A-associated hydrolase 2
MLYAPQAEVAPAGTVVYVHPFAEEMNKSRRMAALQARALAEAGFAVLQPDLLGCGDSDGEFGEATWDKWVEDVVAASEWLRARFGGLAWLWSLRAGCLLAVQAARVMSSAPHQLFWQPVLSGRQHLQHLLRLRLAAQLVSPAEGKRADTRELRARFDQGYAVEIAGYELSSALALGLEAGEIVSIPGSVRVEWLEVINTDVSEPSPAAIARTEALRRAGHRARAHAVTGQPFWQTQEITECSALVVATLDAIGARDDVC